jgi:hypothetical protein
MVNLQQERALELTQKQLQYSSNIQYSLPPKIMLLKHTNTDVNNSDEKDVLLQTKTGE